MDTKKPGLLTVEERLAKLEKQSRRLKVAGIVALLLIGVVVLVGAAAPKPKTVEAEKFVLLDAAGKKRAEWGMLEGFPRLVIDFEKGEKRTEVGPDYLGLNLLDELSRPRASLMVDSRGDPSLVLRDEKGTPRATLFVQRQLSYFSPGLRLSDSEGVTRARLDVRPKSGRPIPLAIVELGELSFLGKSNKRAAALDVRADGTTVLTLHDKDGEVSWQAPPPGE